MEESLGDTLNNELSPIDIIKVFNMSLEVFDLLKLDAALSTLDQVKSPHEIESEKHMTQGNENHECSCVWTHDP